MSKGGHQEKKLIFSSTSFWSSGFFGAQGKELGERRKRQRFHDKTL